MKTSKNNTLNQIILLANKTVANNFEHFNLSSTQINQIINLKPTDVDKYEYRTIYQFNKALEWVLSNNKALEFEDILNLHELVAYNLALNPGEFATSDRYITSKNHKFIVVKPKDITTTKREFNKLIFRLNNEQDNNIKKKLIIKHFINQIIEQWFNDANKRISLLVVNKLLLEFIKDNKINLLIDFEPKQFNNLLSEVYINKYLNNNNANESYNEFINFLLSSISQYDINELKQENIISKQFSSLNNVISSVRQELNNSEQEFYSLKEQQVVYKINNIEMVAYDLEDFINSINDDLDLNKIKFIE